MTRRQLARILAQDLRRRGLHYENGSTVWCALDGSWSALPGVQRPAQDALFYELLGWDQVASRNTTDAVDLHLFRLERERHGKNKHRNRTHAVQENT